MSVAVLKNKKVFTAFFIRDESSKHQALNPENKNRPLKGRIIFRGTTLFDRCLSAHGPLGIKEQIPDLPLITADMEVLFLLWDNG
jgi:hypothetical protein